MFFTHDIAKLGKTYNLEHAAWTKLITWRWVEDTHSWWKWWI